MKVTRTQLMDLRILDRGKPKGACRWCGEWVPQGNRVYCSKECYLKTYHTYYWPWVAADVCKRDNYTCQCCGELLRTPDPAHKGFYTTKPYNIHHITTFLELVRLIGTEFNGTHDQYIRALMDAFYCKHNLETLCLKCHGKQYHPRYTKKTDHLEDRKCIIHALTEHLWRKRVYIGSNMKPRKIEDLYLSGGLKLDYISLSGLGEFQKMILKPQQMKLF